MSKQEYEFHPFASVLPMLGVADANELAADILANGLREEIVLFEGKILDGRNRYRACKTVGVEPRFVDLNGDGDPIDFIVSKNIKRRHLTQSQKAMVVAKFAQLPRGDISRIKSSKTPINSQTVQSTDRETGQDKSRSKSAAQVAKEVDVSTSTVEQAKRVLRDAPKDTVKAVEEGKKSVATAVKEIKTTKANEEAAKEKHHDKTGYVIPESIREDWQRAEGYSSTLREISKIKSGLKKGLEDSDLIFAEVNNTTVSTLTNAYGDLKRVLPYAVCPTCQGRTPKKCATCRGRGFVSEFYYTTCVPEETRKIREKAIRK
jgi:hypothetical protein